MLVDWSFHRKWCHQPASSWRLTQITFTFRYIHMYVYICTVYIYISYQNYTINLHSSLTYRFITFFNQTFRWNLRCLNCDPQLPWGRSRYQLRLPGEIRLVWGYPFIPFIYGWLFQKNIWGIWGFPHLWKAIYGKSRIEPVHLAASSLIPSEDPRPRPSHVPLPAVQQTSEPSRKSAPKNRRGQRHILLRKQSCGHFQLNGWTWT